jgi:hypothetical protein
VTRGKTGILVATGAYNKAQVLPRASAVLQAVRRTIRIHQSVLSLCEKRKKGKIFYKKNSPRMLLLADLTFAIDAQQQ